MRGSGECSTMDLVMKDFESHSTMSHMDGNDSNDMVVLILERDMIIAADLTEALKSRRNLHVIHVATPEDCAKALHGIKQLHAAIVELRPSEYDSYQDQLDLALRTANVIFTNGEDERQLATARGWAMLPRPFNDEMLDEALSRFNI